MQIESVALNKIIPYIRNPRKNENAIEKVASSIKEFGFRQPIVVDSENVIIAGHTRFEAAKRLGLDVVPIHVADGLTEQQAKAYRIADNRVGQEAEWDYDLLKLELEELDNPELTGFDEDELNGILAEVGEGMTGEGLTDPDYVPEVQDDPVTVSGDLWELGEHRLLCDDATKPNGVERLMDGEKADMVFTDPPYAIFGSSTGIASDISDDNMVRPFFRDILKASSKILKEFGHVYCCCDWRSWASWWDIAKLTDLEPKNMIVWDKGGGQGAMYTQNHELVGFFVKQPKETALGKKKTGHRTIRKFPKNVFRINRETDRHGHNAAKPVELCTNAIENSSDIGELCIDFFFGSGTTLIACQKIGRKCYGMELNPHFCDVIISRWSEFTGKDDLLLNGKPFKWSERKIKKAA